MKALACALALLILAGCTSTETPNGTDDLSNGSRTSTTMSVPANTTTAAVAPFLDAPSFVQSNGSLSVQVTTAPGMLVSAVAEPALPDLSYARIDVGLWRITSSAIPFGHTNLTVLADNGEQTLNHTILVVRNMTVTMEAKFRGTPGVTDRTETFSFDPGLFLSKPDYEGKSVSHPGHATVHDAMVAWTLQSTVVITYDFYNSLGYSVRQIDGVGNPVSGLPAGAWCYTLNGKSAPLGISSMAIADGDLVSWNLGCA